MEGEALLVAIATVAVVVAGFTAVTAALVPPGGSWSPALRIRHRAIVSTSFNVVFEALAPLIAFAWFGDAHVALVVTSAGVALYTLGIVLWRGSQVIRAGGYRSRSGLVLIMFGPTATVLFAVNIVVASVALFALALCVQLSVAVISFYSLIAAAQT
jgi:hypothetical protein